MTDQQINIAIAQACGWTGIGRENGVFVGWPPGRSGDRARIPDYSSDLNMMHEAEGALSDDQTWIFSRYITSATLDEPKRSSISAAARQRAEAFLKTLNLWKS